MVYLTANVMNLRCQTVELMMKPPDSYIVADAGSEIVALGSGWDITKRGEMLSINIG